MKSSAIKLINMWITKHTLDEINECKHSIKFHIEYLYLKNGINVAKSKRESIEYCCYRFVK